MILQHIYLGDSVPNSIKIVHDL